MAYEAATIAPSERQSKDTLSKHVRAAIQLKRGNSYFFDGQQMVFERYGEDNRLIFKLIHTELTFRVDWKESRSDLPTSDWVISMISAGRFHTRDPGPSLVKSNRFMMGEEEARKIDPGSVIRYKILVGLDKLGSVVSDDQIKIIADRVKRQYPEEAKHFVDGLTPRTVKEWRKKRGSFQERAWSDCISKTGKGPRPRRLNQALTDLISASALYYWTNKTASKVDAYNHLTNAITIRNALDEASGTATQLHCPSPTTLSDCIDELETFQTMRAKFGEVAARAKFKAMGKAIPASRILELVQIDHTIIDLELIDLDVLDGPTKTQLGKPTLATVICVKSRCILAWYISFAGPSLASVIQALKRCLRPKLNCIGSSDFPILQDIFGLPSNIVCDNGMEFVGTSIQDQIQDLGITLVASKVASPESKAFVERLFGTLNSKLFHKLPGTTLNKSKREEHADKFKSEATITLQELEELTEHVAYAYHISPHSGLDGRPPALVWQEDAARYGIPVLLSGDRLDPLLGILDERTLSNDGIELFGLQYNDRPTTNIILEEECARLSDRKRASLRVKIKYNPYDLGHIWIFREKDNDYLQFPCVDLDYASGLTLAQHKTIRKHLRETGLEFSSIADRAKARVLLQNRILELTPNATAAQRRATAKLVSMPSVASKRDLSGLTSITGKTLLPHEPLVARSKDAGAIPKGSLRGASKARKTRQDNAERHRLAQERYDATMQPNEALWDVFTDADWEPY